MYINNPVPRINEISNVTTTSKSKSIVPKLAIEKHIFAQLSIMYYLLFIYAKSKQNQHCLPTADNRKTVKFCYSKKTHSGRIYYQKISPLSTLIYVTVLRLFHPRVSFLKKRKKDGKKEPNSFLSYTLNGHFYIIKKEKPLSSPDPV